MERRLIIFIDSGDTIIDEGSQVFDEDGTVLRASVVPGADKALNTLHDLGYRICLVADGRTQSFTNVLTQNGVWELLDTKTISEEVGAEKPDLRMFEDAMRKNALADCDKSRIVMIGNNLVRDIRGANLFGITSVLLDWSPRYDMQPKAATDIPDYIVHDYSELVQLIERLNENI